MSKGGLWEALEQVAKRVLSELAPELLSDVPRDEFLFGTNVADLVVLAVERRKGA